MPNEEVLLPPLFGTTLKQPQRRKVCFYDTRELALSAAGLVLRARVTQGDEDDSTVKVRPASLDHDAPWRAIEDSELELDIAAKGPTLSAKLDRKLEQGKVENVEAGKPIASLFAPDQEALVKAYAPAGPALEELKVLGPVDAHKWVLEGLAGFDYGLCIEEWSLPDTTRFIELSIKVKRDKASQAQEDFHDLLRRLKVKIDNGQGQKTPIVLKFFAERI